jgi:hypothetical protein
MSQIKNRKIRGNKSQRELSADVPSPSERVRVRCFCKGFIENETAPCPNGVHPVGHLHFAFSILK